jgi:hypothetical protein
VFIDELPQIMKDYVKLLRNICRAVHIPTILSGTNSAVNNLLGRSHINTSRTGGSPLLWVKVVCKFPKATLKTIAHVIKFKNFRDPNSEDILLKDCIASNEVFLNSLIDDAMLASKNIDRAFLLKLTNFIFEQANSNLPGLAILSLKVFIEIIVDIRGSEVNHISRERIWGTITGEIISSVIARKPQIISKEGQLAGAHVLTFKSYDEEMDSVRVVHEKSELAASKVDNNLFYYGTRDMESIIELTAGPKNSTLKGVKLKKLDPPLKEVELKKFDSGKPWTDLCFFPSLCEDFFSHLVIWNSWWDIDREPYFSLSTIYLNYLDEKKFPVNSKAKVVDSFALELLSNWAIAYASHWNISGHTFGIDVLKNFVRNIQSIDGVTAFDCDLHKSFTMSTSLNAFLKRIKVPYLVNYDSLNPEFANQVSDFIRLGRVVRPENNVGLDILFDLYLDDEIKSYGLIECKLWSVNTDCATIFTYYHRACIGKCPLSFIVAPKFASDLLIKFCSSDNDLKTESKDAEEEDEKEQEQEEEDENIKKRKLLDQKSHLDLDEAMAFLSIELNKKKVKKATVTEDPKKEKTAKAPSTNNPTSTAKPSSKASSTTKPSSKASSTTKPSSKASSTTKPSNKASSTTKPSNKASSTTKPSNKASSTTKPADKASSADNSSSTSTTNEKDSDVSWRKSFLDLWAKSPNSCINIYFIRSIVMVDKQKVKSISLRLETIKEFENPTGVFFMVESNFRPRLRSQHA